MTTQEPENWEAGRALDTQIAMTMFPGRYTPHTSGTVTANFSLPIHPSRWNEGRLILGGDDVPPFSTDMNAAWLIVEHLRDQHWTWAFFTHSHPESQWHAVAQVSPFPVNGRWHQTTAPTMPLAICRVALAMVQL